MPKINLPLQGRTFDRGQGCWNCTGRASMEASLEHWKRTARPREDQRIREAKEAILNAGADPAALARIKTGRNAPCPCGSGDKYKRCHLAKDEASARVMKQIEGIEMAVAHLDRFERAITQRDPILGFQALCRERTSEKYDNYTADAYLCDRWNGVQGASLAREGRALDATSEELKDKVGDGN